MVGYRTNLFASFLERKLKERDLTVGDLSQRLGVDKSLIYKWLKSERTPSIRTNQVDNLVHILNLSAAESIEFRDAYQLSLRGEGNDNRELVEKIILGMHHTITPFEFEHAYLIEDTEIVPRWNVDQLGRTLSYFLSKYGNGNCMNLFIDWEFLVKYHYIDNLISILDALLDNYVIVNHIVSLQRNSHYNIEILFQLWPLIIKYPNYNIKYISSYNYNYSSEVLCGDNFTIQLGQKNWILSTASSFIRYSQEEFANLNEQYSLPLVKLISKTEFYTSVGELLGLPDSYNLLGISTLFALDRKKEVHAYSIFVEDELDDFLRTHPELTFSKENIIQQINTSSKQTLIINENLFIKSNFARYIVRAGYGALLAVNTDTEPIYIKITENFIVDELVLFLSDLIYKYTGRRL